MRTLAPFLIALLLGACASSVTPGEPDSDLIIEGTVRDSTGALVPLARVSLVADSGPYALATTTTDVTGHYVMALDSLPAGAEAFRVIVRSADCLGTTIADTLTASELRAARVRDYISPTRVPHTPVSTASLCAADHWPGWTDGWVYVLLTFDSTQSAVDGATTHFGGTWNHATAISTYGWAGTFSGTQTTDSVHLQISYRDTLHYQTPVVGCEQQTLSTTRAATGQWQVFRSTAPACPIGQQALLFYERPSGF